MPTDDVRRPRVIADAARRRWWIVLGAGSLAALLGMGFAEVNGSSYVGRASVLVAPLPGTAFDEQLASTQLQDLTSEAQFVRSDRVAQGARERLLAEGREPPGEAGMLAATDAEVEVNTQVLRITFTSSERTLARDGANAVAAAYLAHREALARAANRAALADLAERAEALEAEITRIRDQLNVTTPGTGRAAQLQGALDVQDDALNDVIAQQLELERRELFPGEVLSPAPLPSQGRGIPPHVAGSVGLVLGLVAGALGAALLERLAGRIRRADALPEEPPVLGVVGPADGRLEPVLLGAPDSDPAEAYRVLHLALDAALPDDARRGHVVAVATVSGPAPPVAANLALAAGAGGRVVTLVEAIPSPPARAVPTAVAPRHGPGLSDALLGNGDPIGFRTTSGRGLTVLGPGADLDRAADGFIGPRMRAVLDTLRRAADLVVVTSPPLSDPDGQALAAVVDHVLLVVTLGHSTLPELENSLTEARRVQAHVIGVVAAEPSDFRPTPPATPAASTEPAIVAQTETARPSRVGT